MTSPPLKTPTTSDIKKSDLKSSHTLLHYTLERIHNMINEPRCNFLRLLV